MITCDGTAGAALQSKERLHIPTTHRTPGLARFGITKVEEETRRIDKDVRINEMNPLVPRVPDRLRADELAYLTVGAFDSSEGAAYEQGRARRQGGGKARAL